MDMLFLNISVRRRHLLQDSLDEVDSYELTGVMLEFLGDEKARKLT